MSKSERFWDKLSKDYDTKAKDKTFEQILRRTPKYLHSEAVVLDFGCATGLYAFAFADAVKTVYAFDTSTKMILKAKNMAEKNGNHTLIFSQTTLFDDRYKEGSFDIILGFNILLYFKDIENVLARMHRLLKPNGLIITSTACLKEKRTCIGILSGTIIHVLKKIGVLPYLNFLKMGELKTLIIKSGFTIIESEVLIEKPATEYFIVAKKEP
ncbi:class I SAM-dependent methyltransferase [Costertonia aggregata]|uniref:Methyltransferase domain-containing protein n=1 Tax=Costertonia aggregata TaxID=343403 RepID=A0A7H9ATZ7_9FLAO|nr:class I SAM-dependent methyltransferase [Costertonia aggregata]QLG46896.1 methyltransferase domain-containing protein [Costertonia aggregata]